MSLFDYLAVCSADEYRSLWQWAYQGASGHGMKVIDNNGVLVMDGFSMNVPAHINKLPAVSGRLRTAIHGGFQPYIRCNGLCMDDVERYAPAEDTVGRP